MAIGRISGSVLKSNLTRNGTDLAFETNLLYLDVTNSRIGVGTSEPTSTLHITGNATVTGDLSLTGNLSTSSGTFSPGQITLSGNSITTNQSNANLELSANGSGTVSINGILFPTADGTAGQVLATDGAGNVSFTDLSVGDLTITGSTISTPSNADLTLSPGGSGAVVLPRITIDDNRIKTTQTNQRLHLNGAGTSGVDFNDSILLDDNRITTIRTNDDLVLSGSGTGTVTINGLSFPTADGDASQVLQTDGSGNLSFVSISTNSISQGNSNITVTDTGSATISVTTDGTNILNFTTALPIDASNSDKAFRLPNGTSGQRPAGQPGMIRYNSSTDKIEGYTTAGGWAEFGASEAAAGGDETGDAVLGIGVNAKNIDTFTTGTYDSAFYYVITRDETNDEVSTARYSLVHNDSDAFVATSHITESDPANDYVTVDADIDSGTVRLRGTGTSDINSVSFYEIPLGDNSTAGTTGKVTIFKNADVDSVAESIDSWSLSSIRGAKYFISIKDDASGEVSNTEAMVVHDGSTAYITQYGTVNATNGNRDLITLTAEVDSTAVVVKAQGAIANCRITGYRIALGDSESDSTGDNVNVIGATTVSSAATEIDTFQSDVYTGAFYVVVGYNATEGAASISEVQMVTNNGVAYISTGPVLSTKDSDQLTFTAGVSGTTVSLNAASTSGSSTTVNAYRVHLLRGVGGEVAETVTVSGDQGISGTKTFTSPVVLQVSSDPTTVADGAHIYAKDESASAEVYVRDEAGNVTKISPHNDQGEWEYYSRNTKTGKTVRVNMEQMIRDIEKLTGKTYIQDE